MPDALGIPGLTIGSVVISCVVALFGTGGILAVWVKSRADMKRAGNEGDGSLRHDLMALHEQERTEWKAERTELREKIKALETDNTKLHGQIHELRNQMVELMLAAGKIGSTRAQAAARKKFADAAKGAKA